mmetsp:Transcript_17243/g.22435  ORF Transcript_17243/g.22435 Transcript_17243/m.22435 type:complete len:336 (-) Transcript_17243:84-1091(-)|eukprot:CAMPEP_0198151034 /NCGR_PEP_ID=MMETSP1443-20131203/53813_1 /TAXON_ID=186043 /ORGANISM="Entomoneis sp., Strain CCMP2396" /LENGTH=335 /DNA_ID=CAMNT_0043816555 /DNA_START=139 /DNA_END=1146 /DNA_ORIENTATION=+
MATVVETKERVNRVKIEGLALLKIVKHCHESLPAMVTGSLLGLTDGTGALEITHSFPFPDSKHHNKNNSGDDGIAAEDAAGLEGHEFQLEMMRMLREVNVDNNCVGWYQSMYLGIYSTSNLLENQLSYQTDLSPNAVVILYDPMQTTNGSMVLKCYRLSDECIASKKRDDNTFINPKNIFEEIPVILTNPGLVRALLTDISVGEHPTGLNTKNGLYELGSETSLERLDMSTNPYLEKHLEFLCGWVDELASEQHKFQYYTRQLSRNEKGNKKSHSKKAADDADAWASNEAPRRLESLLLTNQIRSYVDQMDKFSGAGLSKLYLLGGLHQNSNTNN